jgi:hypothetical protein
MSKPHALGIQPAISLGRFERRFNICAVFWGLAYIVLTVHALLDPTSSGLVLSGPRFLATAAGATMLFAILLLWDRTVALQIMLRVQLAALAIGSGCAAMYAVRLFVALEFGNYGPSELADGGRWVIAWAGYFLAAVSTTIAWQAIAENAQLRRLAASRSGYETADDALRLGQ